MSVVNFLQHVMNKGFQDFPKLQIFFEHFQQISEIVESNLSRNQYILEVIFPLNKNLYVNLNVEMEDFLIQEQTDASSLTLALGWEGDIRKLF